MKSAAIATLCVASTSAFSIMDTLQFLGGLNLELIKSDQLVNVDHCVQDADILKKDIMDQVTDFKKMSFDGFTQGLKSIGDVMTNLPQDIRDCESMKDDIPKLEAWKTAFEHPWTMGSQIAKNLFWHFDEVNSFNLKALQFYTNSDYYNAGINVGKATVLLAGTAAPVIPNTPKKPHHWPVPIVKIKDALEFFGGLNWILIESDNLRNTENCIKGGDTMVNNLKKTVILFEKGGMQNYLDACKSLGTAFVEIPQEVSDCESMRQDLPKVQAFIGQFKDPKAVIETIGTNLWSHFDYFHDKVDGSVDAVNHQQFYSAGEMAGQALWMALKGEAKTYNQNPNYNGLLN